MKTPEQILRSAEEAACKTEAEFIALGQRRGYPGAVGWGKRRFALRLKNQVKKNAPFVPPPIEYPPGYFREYPNTILAYKD